MKSEQPSDIKARVGTKKIWKRNRLRAKIMPINWSENSVIFENQIVESEALEKIVFHLYNNYTGRTLSGITILEFWNPLKTCIFQEKG